MSSSEEMYLGVYIKFPDGLDLMDAVYEWGEDNIQEDRFIDAWRELGESPSIWLSNYTSDNIIPEDDSEFLEIPFAAQDLARFAAIDRFKKKFQGELKTLDDHNINYFVEYGFITYIL